MWGSPARRAGGRAESLPGRGRSVPSPALPAAASCWPGWLTDKGLVMRPLLFPEPGLDFFFFFNV